MTAAAESLALSREAAVQAAVAEFKAGGGFVWGASDCCHFAATVVAKITGSALIIREFEQYDSMMGALRVIARKGGLAAMIDQYLPRLGEDEEPRTGDLVLISATVLGVVYRNRALGIREDGLGTHPLALVRTVQCPIWRVG